MGDLNLISSNRLRLCGLVCRRVKTNVVFGWWKRYARGQWIGRPFPARWRPQYPLCREEGFAAANGWESSTGGGIFAPARGRLQDFYFFCFWQILRLMQTDTRYVADGNSGQARNQYVPETMAGVAMYNGDRSGRRDGDKRHRRYPSLCCPVIMRKMSTTSQGEASRKSKRLKIKLE